LGMMRGTGLCRLGERLLLWPIIRNNAAPRRN
jgi:hypothetical protein